MSINNPRGINSSFVEEEDEEESNLVINESQDEIKSESTISTTALLAKPEPKEDCKLHKSTKE